MLITRFTLASSLAGALWVGCSGCSGDVPVQPMSGYAEAELIYVAASAAGQLETLAVARGDNVKRGQLLFALDAAPENFAASAAAARQERAEALAANLRKGRRPAELKAADEQLAQAQAALAASTSLLERQQQLVKQGFMAPIRLEELQAARGRDAARVRELQAQRVVAGDAARPDEIGAAVAEARGALADADLMRWRVGQKRREAPLDARVLEGLYRAGDFGPAGAPVLALLPPGAIKLRFFVAEPQLARVAVGSAVGVRCDGCAGGLTARITYVSPQAEFTPPVIYSNSSRSKLVYMAEARPEGAAMHTLKPGQPVEVSFDPVPPK